MVDKWFYEIAGNKPAKKNLKTSRKRLEKDYLVWWAVNVRLQQYVHVKTAVYIHC